MRVTKGLSSMTLVEKLIKRFGELSDARKEAVLDYVDFLRNKEARNLEKIMDEVILENQEAFRALRQRT